MFENRVPHMLNSDYTPHSALDIFVKDLVCQFPSLFLFSTYLCDIIFVTNYNYIFLQGIVCHESAYRKIPVVVSTVAYQQFVAGLTQLIFVNFCFCLFNSMLISLLHVSMMLSSIDLKVLS